VYVLFVMSIACYSLMKLERLNFLLSFRKIASENLMSIVVVHLVIFQTWMYISVPLVLYIGERTLRAFRSKAYAVKILKVTEL
jgi:hypothetical protein